MHMTRKTRNYDKYHLESLKDPANAAAFLNAVIEDDDNAAFLLALRDILQAKGGLSTFAAKTHVNQSSEEELTGFQRLNPLGLKLNKDRPYIPCPQHVLDPESQEKFRLAEKLIHGEKMTKTEKRQIYKYLTGEDAPQGMKRGRRAEIYRDIGIAMDYIAARAEGEEKAKDVRKKLAKLYDLNGLTDVLDDTFYKAFHNGLALLETTARDWIESVEIGVHGEMEPEKRNRWTAKARQHLEFIDKFKNRDK